METDRKKEVANLMTEKTRQTVKHIDRETWRSEDLGGAERMCERPSLDEELD
jgi:hypothetical protein